MGKVSRIFFRGRAIGEEEALLTKSRASVIDLLDGVESAERSV